MHFSAILIAGAALLSAVPAVSIDTLVLLDGECDFRIDGQKLECAGKTVYTTFTNRRVEISALPTLLAAVAFSGGKDIQLEPGSYQLTVDRLILSGGTVVPADGFCSVEMRADGQRVYKVEGKAFAHDGRRFEFDFKPIPKPPTIKHFDVERKASQSTNCQSTLIVHGLVFRGSAVCNQAWLDRPGSYKLLAEAQACNQIAGAKKFLARGFRDFDRKAREIGMSAACQEINEIIQKFE